MEKYKLGRGIFYGTEEIRVLPLLGFEIISCRVFVCAIVQFLHIVVLLEVNFYCKLHLFKKYFFSWLVNVDVAYLSLINKTLVTFLGTFQFTSWVFFEIFKKHLV